MTDYETADFYLSSDNTEHHNVPKARAALYRLKDRVIEWHRYPEETPQNSKVYLVTYISEGKKAGGTYLATYYSHEFEMVDDEYWLSKPTIIAWAELPKPYKG